MTEIKFILIMLVLIGLTLILLPKIVYNDCIWMHQEEVRAICYDIEFKRVLINNNVNEVNKYSDLNNDSPETMKVEVVDNIVKKYYNNDILQFKKELRQYSRYTDIVMVLCLFGITFIFVMISCIYDYLRRL